MSVHVVTDSVASIPASEVRRLDIDVLTLYVNDGVTNQADIDIEQDSFFRRLADVAHLPTSSQPCLDAFVTTFRAAIEHGSDVVGVFISEKMSGTLQGARLAADMVREQFPDARIELVDAMSNSMQEGYAVLAAAAAAAAGESVERCIDAARDTIRRTRYLFTPSSLEYLRKGGRIGQASALLGQLLQIKPILTVEDGEVQTFAKVRTQSRALAEMARKLADDTAEFGLSRAVVHYIGDREPAERFAEQMVVPITGFEVDVIPVSAVIGVHVGPAVGLVYETERAMRA